ncbi:ABC transporter substrate-binding protein [Clostridium sp. SYSU_GA19001]|uniref:ABC transporter substrate-binding protein n=1 Tax=Clostridium caldaquaticum TaxID=2940653 RepID=UPI002077803B|nr:ABC transporter substrate-binding protein [Clostridium caldaquaticum]MCM8711539.1 ABC transporter substrate-binding protein [Clostridium caldaquaticum]
MKKFTSMLLTTMIAALTFTGCSSKEVSNAGDSSTVSSEPLSIAMFSAGNDTDTEAVANEVSKITKEKIGVEINITRINFGSWQQQINLMLSSDEKLDLFPAFITPLSTYVANGQVIQLDDLYSKYGSGIAGVIDKQYIDAGKINGKLYGITTNRDLAASYGFVYRKDIAEKYNIDMSAVKNMEDLTKVFAVIKEKEPGMYPLVPQSGASLVETAYGVDRLGDGNLLGVIMNRGDSLSVTNYYETDFYKNFVKLTRSWFKAGYMMPNALNNTETASTFMTSGKAFGYFSNLKPGFAEINSVATGKELATVTFIEGYATTGNAQGLTWAIAKNSKMPDKAMQFLNLAYTDKDISTLLIYGIKDKHYKVVDEQNNIIDYVDGVTPANTAYNPTFGWGWCANQFITPVWKGNSGDYWKQLDNFNKTAFKSKAMGFTFDPEKVKNEITAATSVVSKYQNALSIGAIDPEEALPKFNNELKAAGLDKIIAEKQAQLDAWAATQK